MSSAPADHIPLVRKNHLKKASLLGLEFFLFFGFTVFPPLPSNVGQVLGRVSVVNYKGATIFDTFVCYPEQIIITNTDEKFSGIGLNDIDPRNGAQPFADVQVQLVELLRGRIVIGHDVKKI